MIFKLFLDKLSFLSCVLLILSRSGGQWSVWLLSKCLGEEKLSMREIGEIGERGLKGENMMECNCFGHLVLYSHSITFRII